MKSIFSNTALAAIMAAAAVSGLSAASNDDKSMGGIDSKFAMKAASGGMAEVKLGQLALTNASSQDVKTFAQRMVDDHSKANDKLKGLASKDSISLPSDMDTKDQAVYDRLSKLHGVEFDRAYMRDMVKDHKMDIAEFQKEANSGKNADLKSFATDTLPTLQAHLKMAESTDSNLK